MPASRLCVFPGRCRAGWRLWLLSGLLWLSCAPGMAHQVPVTPLRLHSALPLEGPPGLQPSGLTACQGRLLLVSDRHDRDLFRLQITATSAQAQAVPLGALPSPPLADFPAGMRLLQDLQQQLLGRQFDWEGITCDPQGALYLASEAQAAVLRLPAAGKPEWLANDYFNAAFRKGLLQRHNALLEGISWTEQGLLLAAEREQRGLIVLQSPDARWRLSQIVPLGATPGLDRARASDLAGLWWEQGRLYTLERNQSALCRRRPPDWVVERCWTYRAEEWSDALGYQGVRYGQGEGVARYGALLYLVLDNNDRARRSDPADRRPLLLRFHLPEDWLAEEHLGPMGVERPTR